MVAHQLRVFVSHSHEDDAFCQALVQGLRDAGADVWYDEHNLESGQLLDTIEQELRARPVFVLILSPAALHSQWVRDESKWAFTRFKRDPSRVILPVLAAPLPDEDNIWLFMQDFKRIEAIGLQPFPLEEAVRRTLRALALTPAGEASAPTAPQPMESADDLIARGKVLQAQGKHTEALPLFERATQIAPTSFGAWYNLGSTLNDLERWQQALAANVHATRINPSNASAWSNRGIGLGGLERYVEALAAFDHATALDPNNYKAWYNKGKALRRLRRVEDALAAYDRALALNPNLSAAWNNKGSIFGELKRYNEALVAFDRATTLDPNDSTAWTNKASALRVLGRTAEAEAAKQRADALGG